MIIVAITLSLIQIAGLAWLIHREMNRKQQTSDEPVLPVQNSYGMIFKKKKLKPTVIDDERAWALEKKQKTGLDV